MAGVYRIGANTTSSAIFIRISVPELKEQKCLQFHLGETVWEAKRKILAAFSQELKDPLNYGLYLPPQNGRAGKFLEEERLLKEYPLEGPVSFFEFKYKRRVYKMMELNPRKVKQLHSKASLKQFREHVRHGEVDRVAKMTSRGLDPNYMDPDDGETPLTVAVGGGGGGGVRRRTREVVLCLVSGGAHLDFRNRAGLTPLHVAAASGNGEAVRTLLDLGVSPNLKDGQCLTPLYHTLLHSLSPLCAHLLLHERAFVGTPDHLSWQEIHQACRYGSLEQLQLLLRYGADVNGQTSSGDTPLHVCASYNQESCARELLLRGADPRILNLSKQTAYHVAFMAESRAVAEALLRHREEDVEPILELPQYSNRRRNPSSAQNMHCLARSRSDSRLHDSLQQARSHRHAASQQRQQCQQQLQQQRQPLMTLQDFYNTADYAENDSVAASYAVSTKESSRASVCSRSVSSIGSLSRE